MANNLAKYRGKHGLTQEQLGARLGITKAAISAIEKNKLCGKTAVRCSEILGENPFALMGTDVLKMLPQTEEDKKILIEIIQSL